MKEKKEKKNIPAQKAFKHNCKSMSIVQFCLSSMNKLLVGRWYTKPAQTTSAMQAKGTESTLTFNPFNSHISHILFPCNLYGSHEKNLLLDKT